MGTGKWFQVCCGNMGSQKTKQLAVNDAVGWQPSSLWGLRRSTRVTNTPPLPFAYLDEDEIQNAERYLRLYERGLD
jgi:hypothetical protein